MLEQFPQPLKEARRWVCFDAAKTPINPATGKNAMPNEPSTWGTLAAAPACISCSPAQNPPAPAARAASGWKCTTAAGISP